MSENLCAWKDCKKKPSRASNKYCSPECSIKNKNYNARQRKKSRTYISDDERHRRSTLFNREWLCKRL
jgi:hypothetical protein